MSSNFDDIHRARETRWRIARTNSADAKLLDALDERLRLGSVFAGSEAVLG